MSNAPPSSDRARTWFWRVWTVVGLGILGYGLLSVFSAPLGLVLPPLALAAILVYLLNPIVSWFERHGLRRMLATPLTYVLVFGLVVAAAAAVLPLLVRQTGELIERVPDMAVGLQDVVNSQLERIGLSQRIVLDFDSEQAQQALQDLFSSDAERLFGILRGAGTVVASVLHGLLTLIVAPFIAFYLLIDLPRLSVGLRQLIPPASRSEVFDVAGRIGRTVGAYFRGQLMVAAFVGVGTAIGLAMIGLPFWAIVGVAAGLFNLVPFIGPVVGGVVGALIALTVGGGPRQAVAVVIVMVVVQQIDNHVITPNILSRTVKVHPVTIIVALAVAASLFGILGMLVVIPALAATKLVLLYLLVTRVPSMRHLAGEGPGVIDGVPVADPRDSSLVAMGRDLREVWESRRRRRADSEVREEDATSQSPR